MIHTNISHFNLTLTFTISSFSFSCTGLWTLKFILLCVIFEYSIRIPRELLQSVCKLNSWIQEPLSFNSETNKFYRIRRFNKWFYHIIKLFYSLSVCRMNVYCPMWHTITNIWSHSNFQNQRCNSYYIWKIQGFLLS